MAVSTQEFLLRRLHSLTGMAPMGVFLFEHFFTNSFSHQGEISYNEKVEFLRSLPYLFFIEWGVLFIPFLFHMLYGLKIIYSGEVNVLHENRRSNWMYFLQRLTAFPALAFILYHVITLRFMPHGEGEPNFYRVMIDVFDNPFIFAFYIIGVVSIAFHFANGIATFCITWGLTVSPLSQRVVGYACVGVGVVLAGMAIWSVLGFDPSGLAESAQKAEHAPATVGYLIESFNFDSVRGAA